MTKKVDLTGKRFARLVVIRRDGSDKHKRFNWLCECDCGSLKTIPSRHLVQGNIKSCGCYSAEISAANGKRGGRKISGANSHLFNPLLTNEHRANKRNLVDMRVWRKAVFEMANFTCDVCGERGGKIEAHHLNSWSDHKERRFDPENGICLCRKHHRQFHNSIGGPRQPCTADQYLRFRSAMASATA